MIDRLLLALGVHPDTITVRRWRRAMAAHARIAARR